jgi:hypothetical protein
MIQSHHKSSPQFMLRNIIVMVSIKEFEKGGGFGFWAGFEEVYV